MNEKPFFGNQISQVDLFMENIIQKMTFGILNTPYSASFSEGNSDISSLIILWLMEGLLCDAFHHFIILRDLPYGWNSIRVFTRLTCFLFNQVAVVLAFCDVFDN